MHIGYFWNACREILRNDAQLLSEAYRVKFHKRYSYKSIKLTIDPIVHLTSGISNSLLLFRSEVLRHESNFYFIS
jgi:hypothetical protein